MLAISTENGFLDAENDMQRTSNKRSNKYSLGRGKQAVIFYSLTLIKLSTLFQVENSRQVIARYH